MPHAAVTALSGMYNRITGYRSPAVKSDAVSAKPRLDLMDVDGKAREVLVVEDDAPPAPAAGRQARALEVQVVEDPAPPAPAAGRQARALAVRVVEDDAPSAPPAPSAEQARTVEVEAEAEAQTILALLLSVAARTHAGGPRSRAVHKALRERGVAAAEADVLYERVRTNLNLEALRRELGA